jgi:hypothetical protein
MQCVGGASRTAEGKTAAWVIGYCDDHPMLWASWRQQRDTYELRAHHIQRPEVAKEFVCLYLDNSAWQAYSKA